MDCIDEVVGVLIQCQETVPGLNRRDRLQLNCDKIKWLCCSLALGKFSLLVLDGVPHPHSWLMHNLWVLLDLYLLFYEKLASGARRGKFQQQGLHTLTHVFQAKFKVLVATYKVLHDIGFDFLKDKMFLIVLAHLVLSHR